jgi:CrcB protein
MPDHATKPAVHPVRRAGAGLVPYLAIALGGMVGANVRYFFGLWAIDAWGPHFPLGTLIINVTGSFGLGLLLTLMTRRFVVHPAVRLAIATGFFGAYTTFSTFTVDGVKLLESGDLPGAFVYIVGSTALSLAGAIVGVLLAEAIEAAAPAREQASGEPDPAR